MKKKWQDITTNLESWFIHALSCRRKCRKQYLVLTEKQEQMTEQNENRINVAVPENYNGMPIEVILREGQAPKHLILKSQCLLKSLGQLKVH